jgi:O-antigen ligase
VIGADDSINWLRWLFYLLAGVPFVAWLFFTRDRVLRLTAVVAFLMLVQDNIVGRRYLLGGTSVSPSTVLAYVALVSEVFSQRRLPQLGAFAPLWVGFLFFAATNIVLGSIGTGLWGVNVKHFQIYYLEGILLFAYGLLALRTSPEVIRFSRHLMLIGLGVAAVHVFTAATGFRFRNATAESGIYYAGVLDNTNSLGSLYAMWIPVALSILIGRREPPLWRFLMTTSIVAMLASMLLSGSRGGALFLVLMAFVAFALSRVSARRAIVATAVAGGMAAIGYLVLIYVAPYAWQEVLGIAEQEGLENRRLFLFSRYAQMLLENPLGIGVAPANFARRMGEFGIPGVVSAHNIYLDIALQTGIVGLVLFVWMSALVLVRNRRAAAATTDPIERAALLYVFLPALGFLAVGMVQPIYSISNKLNHLFWLGCGVSVTLSLQILAARRAERRGLEPETHAASVHVQRV